MEEIGNEARRSRRVLQLGLKLMARCGMRRADPVAAASERRHRRRRGQARSNSGARARRPESAHGGESLAMPRECMWCPAGAGEDADRRRRRLSYWPPLARQREGTAAKARPNFADDSSGAMRRASFDKTTLPLQAANDIGEQMAPTQPRTPDRSRQTSGFAPRSGGAALARSPGARASGGAGYGAL